MPKSTEGSAGAGIGMGHGQNEVRSGIKTRSKIEGKFPCGGSVTGSLMRLRGEQMRRK